MKRKTKYIINKIKSIQWKNMNRVLNREAERNNRSKMSIKLDYLGCAFKYKIGYHEYMKGDFANLSKEDRKEMLTFYKYFELIKYLNPIKYRIALDDKIICNKLFHNYIKREFIDLRVSTVLEFKKFIKGKTNVYAKLTDGFGGHGVDKLKVKDIKDINKKYEELIKQRQYLIEEEIKQHDILEKINKFAVNNVRIITILKDNEVHILERVLRINDGSTDTISCIDIQARLDDEGNFICDMVDDELVKYEKHPVTGFPFRSVKVPFMKETLELVKKAAKAVPDTRFIGWDIAITPTGPDIIEANPFPSITNYQYYLMHEKGAKMDYLKQIKDILKEEVDNINI